MMAARTSLVAGDLPDSLEAIRAEIERAVPHGRSVGRGMRDVGSWGDPPPAVVEAWATLVARFEGIVGKHPKLKNTNNLVHLGTLGTGNHFIELCLDEEARVWVMLHSGSRGVGNAIGSFFIELAKEDMRRWFINLPDEDLAYFPEGTEHFDDYVEAVGWAQDFAALNRRIMMTNIISALRSQIAKPFDAELEAVNCHHNYVSRENHFGENVLVTRKGAVRAAKGAMGIIPGSMGAKSFIVRGLGNKESFDSCSHGAGRVMSRNEAKRQISLAEHVADTAGVECRKDAGVIDETPRAYKPIEAVMAAQSDLVEIVHTLKQVVCVKG
jgi:tRNA-splicing ligase RtcB